ADEPLRARLEQLQQDEREALRALVGNTLQARRERAQRFLTAARSALSRLYDPGSEPAALP
ncbi:hypothetical protein ABTL82_18800, partial [Acinetobacter baumannii]